MDVLSAAMVTGAMRTAPPSIKVTERIAHTVKVKAGYL